MIIWSHDGVIGLIKSVSVSQWIYHDPTTLHLQVWNMNQNSQILNNLGFDMEAKIDLASETERMNLNYW